MQQAKFAKGSSIENVKDWLVSHNRDYANVRGRLEAVRNVVLNGRLESAAEILRKSYIFAVMSIRTERTRHENAFVAHFAGEISLKEASLRTVYGGQKYGWIDRTMQSVDWENLAIAVRSHAHAGRWAELLDSIDSNLVGVAHRKGAFMLAMAGLYEYMCIDSNVANYAGLKESDSGQSLSFDSADEYLAACEDIRDGITNGNPWIPPFIVQWAIYDFENGEHARHMSYFREVIGW